MELLPTCRPKDCGQRGRDCLCVSKLPLSLLTTWVWSEPWKTDTVQLSEALVLGGSSGVAEDWPCASVTFSHAFLHFPQGAVFPFSDGETEAQRTYPISATEQTEEQSPSEPRLPGPGGPAPCRPGPRPAAVIRTLVPVAQPKACDG